MHQRGQRNRYERLWRGLFTDLRDTVLARIDAIAGQRAGGIVRQRTVYPEDMADIIDPDDLAVRWAAVSRKLNETGLVLGGQFQRAMWPAGEETPWDADSAALKRMLDGEFGVSRYLEVATARQKDLASAVARVSEAGGDYGDIRSALVEQFGQMTDYESTRIAVTETTRGYGAGGQAWRQSAGVEQKEWVCSFVNSRETHMQAHGQTVGNNDYFVVGGDTMEFPGGGSDPAENINCSCVVVPAGT